MKILEHLSFFKKKEFKYIPFENEAEFQKELTAFIGRMDLSDEPITDDRDKRVICALAERRNIPSYMVSFPYKRI